MVSRGMGMLELSYLSKKLKFSTCNRRVDPGPRSPKFRKKSGPQKKMVHQDRSRVERKAHIQQSKLYRILLVPSRVILSYWYLDHGCIDHKKGVLDMLDVDNMEEYGTTWKHISLKKTSGSSWISCITTVGKCIPTHSYICICWIEEFSHEFANWSTYDTDIIVPDTYIMYTYCP